MHGRLVMKSLERWTDRLPGPELSRQLVRTALTRAVRSPAALPEESQRLDRWLKSELDEYAGWFYLECSGKGRLAKGYVSSFQPVAAGRLRMLVGRGVKVPVHAGGGSSSSRFNPIDEEPWLAVEAEGCSRVRLRYQPASARTTRPYVMIVPCKSQTRARFKTMNAASLELGPMVEACFDDLTFGPYVVAIEPLSN